MNIKGILVAASLTALGASTAACGAGTANGVEMLPSAFDGKTPVVVETDAFKLVINPDATARSLVIKATGEECLAPDTGLPVFAATQKRPFNNETRLVQLAKRTSYPANRIRRDGNLLRIGFETAPYEAEVRVVEKAGYAAFELVRLISNTEQERQYYHWNMDVPPVESFRLLQLPVLERRNFGDWLNVEWDDTAAVAVAGATPYMDVDHERRGRWRLLRADTLAGIGHGLTNGVAVIAAGAGKDAFLAQIDAMEEDYDLPRGVKSRRNPLMNASIYWTSDLTVQNVDEHIANMKKGGFRMMLIYVSGMFRSGPAYSQCGDYNVTPARFPNGYDDIRAVLAKIKVAGITPGFHTLQTFIGFKSSYITPEADPRLNVKRHFALERPLPANSATCDVYVAQNPVDSPMHPKCRVLKFGTELMHYEGYTTTPPYRFTGVARGYLDTTVKPHGRGDGGGILDVCECTATSCCIDQKTSLQDEIADKIAKVYDCGMEFLYFDGSEDVDEPCNVNISLSQWKVARRCGKMPLFTEGCAKTHFGWHLQSGANAFDIFPPEVFKEKIIEYPYPAAQRLARDFTRVDFGWWKIYPTSSNGPVGTQPDMWEYGTSKAAAFDCPSTMQMLLSNMRANGRMDDLLETVRRWEDVRERKWLTPRQKEMLKDPKREFHLCLDGKGGYELVEWRQLDVAGGKDTGVRAFLFVRGGRRVVAYWHVHDRARLVFARPLDGTPHLDAAGMDYFETSLPEEEVRAAFASAKIVPIPEGVSVDLRTAQVVCCDTNSAWCRTAAEELERHLALMAGVRTPSADGFTFAVGEKPADAPPLADFESCARVCGKRLLFWGEEAEHGMESSKGPLFAVYEFLDRKLGVKWVFPGDAGIVARPQTEVTLADGEAWRFVPALPEVCSFRCYRNFRRLKKTPMPKAFRISERDYNRRCDDIEQWYGRMRLASRNRLASGHAFKDWQNRFLKDHPEWFAYIEHPELVRDGKLGRGVIDSQAGRVHGCYSCPTLPQAIVDDWVAKGAPKRMNLCFNDGKYCFCRCPACLALDTRRDGEDFLDHLTDRTVHLYNGVLPLAMKVRSDVDVCAYIYSVYRKPPRREKILYGDHMLFSWVPSLGDDYLADLKAWKAAGMKRFYMRPNYMCYSAVFPRGLERYLYDNFTACMAQPDAVGVMYDGMPRPVTDLEYYVICSLAHRPDSAFDGLMEEFYSQYGAAAPEAKAYFEHVRARSGTILAASANYKMAAVRQRLDDSELGKFAVGGHTLADLEAERDLLKPGFGKPLTPVEKVRFGRLVLRTENALLTFRFLAESAGKDEAAFAAAADALYSFRTANFAELGREGAEWLSATNCERPAWERTKYMAKNGR